MTFLQPNKDTNKKGEKPKDLKNNKKIPIWRNKRYIQACAWVLLTIGLCIIIVTFYVATMSAQCQQFEARLPDSNYNFDGVSENGVSAANISPNAMDNASSEWLASTNQGRITMEHIFGAVNSSLIGCEETSCKIVCVNDANIFTSVQNAMKSSSCPSIDVMALQSQQFPDDTLKNSWKFSNRSVQEVAIRWSNLTKIESGAFNSPMFSNTLIMFWSSMNIHKVESGALLGLYKLKYLTIESFIRHVEPALFQPVQTTLCQLRLNAQLNLQGNTNIFGISLMSKLEYLDLSLNHVNGSLSSAMFASTPNLKYFVMAEAGLTNIESDAFKLLDNKLIFLNLAKNQLTVLAPEILRPVLQNHLGAMVKLDRNKWICDCAITELVDLYKNHRNQFIEAILCMAPSELYGISIDEAKYSVENCEVVTSTIPNLAGQTTVIESSTTKQYTAEVFDSSELSPTEPPTAVFKMRCINTLLWASSSSSSSSSSSGPDSESLFLSPSTSSKSVEALTREVNSFSFPPPVHNFDIKLIASNNSAIISIENTSDLMVIWFSEEKESTSTTHNDISVDYECMRYASPNLVVGPLAENTTYTFCLIFSFQNSISPFNCLPLHVPQKREDNIWISHENKQFTIGMLCLIFFVSTILGGLVAYFGIKAYPDLLEGSKNVLVVKKPDQACYVATISETEYLKKSSLKKRNPSAQDDTKQPASKSSAKHSRPSTPSSDPPAPPFDISFKNLDSFSRSISSTTYFEDPFPDVYLFNQDDYETPKVFENEYTMEQRTVNNMYGMSPGSPPPLPKRNSNISDCPTVVINRLS